MKRPYLSISLASLLIASSTSCTTTGDPTQGGLFCWSERKAIQRSNNLEQQRHELELMLNQNKSKLSQSKRKLSRLNAQIAAHKAKHGENDSEYQKLVQERDKLHSEIRAYEKDMDSSSSGLPLGI